MARWSTVILSAGLTGGVALGWHVAVNPMPWSASPSRDRVTETTVAATPPAARRDDASNGRRANAPLLLTMTDAAPASSGGPARADKPAAPATKSDARPRRAGRATQGKPPGRRANARSAKPGAVSGGKRNGPSSDPAAPAPSGERADDHPINGTLTSSGGVGSGGAPADGQRTSTLDTSEPPAGPYRANATTPVTGSPRLAGRTGDVPRRGIEAEVHPRSGRLAQATGTGGPVAPDDTSSDPPITPTDDIVESPPPDPDPTPDPEGDPAPADGTGGCCLPALPAMCVEMAASACADLGGVYFGDDAACDQLMRRITRVGAQFTLETTTAATCRLSPRGLDQGLDGPVKVDAWVTLGGNRAACGTILRLGCPIPAGFFRPTSEPVQPDLCLQGAPIGPTFVPGFGPRLDFGLADTLVMRLDDPFDRCDAPSPDGVTVPIAIERLRLVSLLPIEVPLDDGFRTETWDVKVEVHTSLGQPLGAVTARKTHRTGGTYDSIMRLCPTITFTSTKTGEERVLDYCATCDSGGLEMLALDVPWVSDAGDAIEVRNPVRSSFRPGVEEENPVPGADCNENGVRDDCDIASGQSQDADGDGVPDECDCPLDHDGSGGVDLGDLIAVLNRGGVDPSDLLELIGAWGGCGGGSL